MDPEPHEEALDPEDMPDGDGPRKRRRVNARKKAATSRTRGWVGSARA